VSADFFELSIRELSRNFGRRRALSRVSLGCRAGETLGLLGPNGAGKSTLLAIVSTLAVPSSGDVTYGGRTAREIGPPLRGRIGVLSHDLHLYSELTALENLVFFGRLYGVADPQEAARAGLERARLADRGGDLVSGFSRGMRQRLALERALLHSPRLLLFDEPFTGLDDASTVALVERLRELRSAGCLTLVATHDLDVAEAVLDRAVILQDGKVVASETDVRDLRKRYQARLRGEAMS
jgi:ABC-type multidrug transport system ATPase subunit